MRKFKFLIAILSLMVFFGSLTACNFGSSSPESSSSSSSAHTCESVCEECGGCMNADCEEAVCEDKCDCEETPPAHECESVCPDCGKCTNADCQEEACEEKCEGHDVVADPNWASYELDVISFNVHIPGSAGTDAYWDGGRGKAVVNFINTCGADIIGLQECNTAPYRDISKGLASNYAIIHTKMGDENDEASIGIIYDRTVFNLVDTDMYNLPKADGTSTKRKAIVLTLEHRVTGEKIKTVNTHAQNGADYATQRKAGFEYIAKRSLSDKDYKFTVMTGDFNTNLDYSATYASISNILQDCRVNAIESSTRDLGTFPKYGANANGGAVYDYIFTTKSEDVEVLTFEVRQDRWGDNKYLSDHSPIQATIKVHNPNHVWSEFY